METRMKENEYEANNNDWEGGNIAAFNALQRSGQRRHIRIRKHRRKLRPNHSNDDDGDDIDEDEYEDGHGPTKTHTNTKAPKETTTKPKQRRRRRRHRRIRIRRRPRRHPKLLAPQSTTKSTAQKIAFGTCSAAGCL